MKMPWSTNRWLQGFGRILLGVWLVATGIAALLQLDGPRFDLVMSGVAIAAGLLILANR